MPPSYSRYKFFFHSFKTHQELPHIKIQITAFQMIDRFPVFCEHH